MADNHRTSGSFSQSHDNNSGPETFKDPPPTPAEGTAALVPNIYRHLGTSLTHRLLHTQEQRDADKATEFALARYDPGMLTNRTNLSTYTNDGRGKDDFKEEWWTESRILLPIHIDRSIKQALKIPKDGSIVQYPAPERSRNRAEFYQRPRNTVTPPTVTTSANLSIQARYGSISPHTADGDLQCTATGQSLEVPKSETADKEVFNAVEGTQASEIYELDGAETGRSVELDDGDDALRALTTDQAFIDITQFAREILDNHASETHDIW